MTEHGYLSDDVVASLPKQQRDEIHAAAFRRLMSHLQERTDVQNIDLMNLAGFCRNCMANWVIEAAADQNLPQGMKIDKASARLHVYNMPYEKWKSDYQV